MQEKCFVTNERVEFPLQQDFVFTVIDFI